MQVLEELLEVLREIADGSAAIDVNRVEIVAGVAAEVSSDDAGDIGVLNRPNDTVRRFALVKRRNFWDPVADLEATLDLNARRGRNEGDEN